MCKANWKQVIYDRMLIQILKEQASPIDILISLGLAMVLTYNFEIIIHPSICFKSSSGVLIGLISNVSIKNCNTFGLKKLVMLVQE